MPPITTQVVMGVKAALAIVTALGITSAGVVVGLSIVHNSGSYETPFAPPQHSVAVLFGQNTGSEACPTCLFVNSDQTSRGRQLDVQQLLNEKPTPTLPLKISFAAPSGLHPKPTPTPQLSPPPSNTTSASSSFLKLITPRPGASKLSLWSRNLFRYIAEFAHALNFTVSGAKEQQAWVVIACGIIWSLFTATTVSYLLRPNPFRGNLRMAININQLLERATLTILDISYIAKIWVSELVTVLKDCFENAGTSRAKCQAVKERRLVDMAKTCINEILAKETAELNQRANRTLKKLRKMDQAKLYGARSRSTKRSQRIIRLLLSKVCEKAIHERDTLATANFEPSFGPSLQNAEREFRGRLHQVGMEEGTREYTIGIFNTVLYSFAYALAAEESKPEGGNARYLSVIDGQNRLIDSLRELHVYREKRFVENEELVRMLCRYDKRGRLIVPNGHEDEAPWNAYSADEDMFITPSLGGPVDLSMNVSVSSASFHNRPDAVLGSDPHWQKFLELTAGKRSEQEARLTCLKKDSIEDEEEERVNTVDEGALGTLNVSQHSEEEYPGYDGVEVNIGIKDASEHNHCDVAASDDDLSLSAEFPGAGYGTPKGSNRQRFSDIALAISTQIADDEALARELQNADWAEEHHHRKL